MARGLKFFVSKTLTIFWQLQLAQHFGSLSLQWPGCYHSTLRTKSSLFITKYVVHVTSCFFFQCFVFPQRAFSCPVWPNSSCKPQVKRPHMSQKVIAGKTVVNVDFMIGEKGEKHRCKTIQIFPQGFCHANYLWFSVSSDLHHPILGEA